jgi:hypothetical protein
VSGRWTLRGRVIASVVTAVVAIAGATVYVMNARAQQRQGALDGEAAKALDVEDVLAEPHIVFRSTLLDQTFGKVVLVPLDDTSGPRAVTATDCERVYSAADRYICLSADRRFATVYRAMVLDQRMTEVRSLPLAGIPSRARMSHDGMLAATTTFVSGHSYAQSEFSTQTVVTRLSDGESVNLEDLDFFVKGQRVTAADRNFWGVTFVDERTFYATGASGGQTWLVRGDLEARRLDALQSDAECPSVSPDGGTVVYKKRQGRAAGQWRLAAYVLDTGEETLLAETRSVDDQVEWIDDQRILYGLPRKGTTAVTDVWSVPVDGSGRPELLLEGAWSPSVQR